VDSSTGIHQFQLVDARGDAHDYVLTEHPAGEGMGVMYELLALGVPSTIGLLGAALQSRDLLGAVLDAVGGGTLAFGADELAKVFAEVDFSKVGPEIGRALGSGKAPALTRQIVSHAIRDGKRLRDDAAFGQAFQANYGELLKLVWKVCSINRFFPVSFTSPDASISPSATGLPGTSSADS
jgi:hypothetical protein